MNEITRIDEQPVKIVPCRYRITHGNSMLNDTYYIEERGKPNPNIEDDFTQMWVITDTNYVLTKSGYWEYEFSPSKRTHEFIEKAYFETVEDARLAFQSWLEKFEADRSAGRTPAFLAPTS